MAGSKFRILLRSMVIILAVILTFLLVMTGNYSAQIHATTEKATRPIITTIFQSITSPHILAKVLIDKAIQAVQNGNRTTTIEYLIACQSRIG